MSIWWLLASVGLHAGFSRAQDSLGTVPDLEFGDDVADVVAHGLGRDHEGARDVAVGHSACNESEHLTLTIGEFGEQHRQGAATLALLRIAILSVGTGRVSVMTEEREPGEVFEDDGPSLVLPEGERLLTVFLHLEDAIGWPAEQPFAFHEVIDPAVFHLLECVEGRHLHEPDEAAAVYPGDLMLRGSVLFRRVIAHADEYSGMSAVMQAFGLGFPLASAPQSELDPLKVERIVAEVTLPIKTNLILRAAQEGHSAVEVPDLASPDESVLTVCYEVAVELVRHLQRAYAAVVREPLELVAMQTQPPMLPYGVRDAHRSPQDEGAIAGFFLVLGSMRHFGPPIEVTQEVLERVHEASEAPDPLIAYTELYNQALVSLHRHGNTRESLVMLGTASEAIIDLVVLLAQWESRLTPEVSAEQWRDSVEKRVTSELPSLLGGQFDLTTAGPVQEWHRHVYTLRNRVVHAGYMPSDRECEMAFDSINGFVTFMADRVFARLRSFPRMATLLFANRWQTQQKPRWLAELQLNPSEVKWSHTAARWIETQRLCRTDKSVPRVPDPERSDLVLVVPALDEAGQLILSDRETELACKAEPISCVWFSNQRRTVAEVISAHDFSTSPAVISIARQGTDDVLPSGDWVERYRLLPNVGVMVDRSDFAVAKAP